MEWPIFCDVFPHKLSATSILQFFVLQNVPLLCSLWKPKNQKRVRQEEQLTHRLYVKFWFRSSKNLKSIFFLDTETLQARRPFTSVLSRGKNTSETKKVSEERTWKLWPWREKRGRNIRHRNRNDCCSFGLSYSTCINETFQVHHSNSKTSTEDNRPKQSLEWQCDLISPKATLQRHRQDHQFCLPHTSNRIEGWTDLVWIRTQDAISVCISFVVALGTASHSWQRGTVPGEKMGFPPEACNCRRQAACWDGQWRLNLCFHGYPAGRCLCTSSYPGASETSHTQILCPLTISTA